MNLIRFCINQSKLINLIVFFIILVGMIIFVTGKKETFPNIDIRYVTITTTYSGTSAEEMENFVTKKIEEAIDGVDGKKKITSTSEEGFSRVEFEIDEDNPIEIDTVHNDIKSAVNDILDDLPQDIDTPKVTKFDFFNQPVISVFIASDSGEDKLRKEADKLKEKLQRLPGVAKVNKNNYREKEIWIEVNPDALRKKKIEINDIYNAINQNNVNVPSGKIKLIDEEKLIRTLGDFRSLEEIENVIIRGNNRGNVVTLKEVAKVHWDYEDTGSTIRINGKDVIELKVVRKGTADIIKVCDGVKSLVGSYHNSMESKNNFEIFTADDSSFFVKRRLSILTNNATVGLFLVFLCLIFFFNLQITFWTILGIPISFCAAMIVANAMGLTLNLITMFGFIIVIGIIVDDAILVAENIYHHIEKGLPVLEATVKGTMEVIWPVVATVATTIAAFAPLLNIATITGQVLAYIPKIVILTMLASLIECLFVLPGHISHRKKKETKEGKIPKDRGAWFKVIQNAYERFLNKILVKPVITLLVVCFISIIMIFAISKRASFVLISGSIDEFNLYVDLPIGRKLENSVAVIDNLETTLRTQMSNEIREIISTAGYQTLSRGPKRGSHLVQMRVLLDPSSESPEKEVVAQMNGFLKNLKSENKIEKYKLQQVRGGPPQSDPIEVKAFGEDYQTLLSATGEIKDLLEQTTNTTAILSSHEKGKEEIIININKKKSQSLRS